MRVVAEGRHACVAQFSFDDAPHRDRAFQHEPFSYLGNAGFLAAVPDPRLETRPAALAADSDGVLFVDMAEVRRNPARIIPARQLLLSDTGAPARPFRCIG